MSVPQRSGPPRWRRIRTVAAAIALLTVVAVGVLAALGLEGHRGDRPAARRSGPAATAPVTRQTLVDAVTVPGQLGYGTTTPISSVATGTVTWLPEPGATVRRGETLLRVDDQPIILLYGPLPMYRPLSVGTAGADVAQFERNLWALGYHGITVDDKFTDSTADAVRRWQQRLKLPPTGTVDRERVIYGPDAIRVAQQLVRVGAAASAEVLAYTGSTRVVTVTADPAKTAWAQPGTRVDLSVAGGTPVAGTVTKVGAAAAGTGSGGGTATPHDAGNTVTVTIGFTDQAALGSADEAPVNVRYVQQERKDVLTVPVNALLALAEGGYGVEVVADGRTRIVTVEIGMFADGRAEVHGDGLHEGALVGVPG